MHGGSLPMPSSCPCGGDRTFPSRAPTAHEWLSLGSLDGESDQPILRARKTRGRLEEVSEPYPRGQCQAEEPGGRQLYQSTVRRFDEQRLLRVPPGRRYTGLLVPYAVPTCAFAACSSRKARLARTASLQPAACVIERSAPG